MNGARVSFASWSTFGQTAFLVFAVLAASQVFVFFVLHAVIGQWHRSAEIAPAVSRFAQVAQRIEGAPETARVRIAKDAAADGSDFSLTRTIALPRVFPERAIEQDLAAALAARNVRFLSVHAGRHGGPPHPPRGQDAGPRDPAARDFGPPRWGFPGEPPPGGMRDEIWLAARLDRGDWLEGRFTAARPWPFLLNPMVVSQFVLFVVLLAVSLLWASGMSRPLRSLARAAENLHPQEEMPPVPVRGPRDVRAAIVAFNAMAQRVRDMLAEKDRMLSAIGHDLRTPLASLRIRAESVEPESERRKLIDTVDEMSRMVEAVLGLARAKHSAERMELVDLSALVDTLAEDYRDLGKEVTFEEAPRTPLEMQVGPVRRLLRNLIDNAIKFGERARLSLQVTEQAIEVRVDDDGPGIPDSEIANVFEPFRRLDDSRSRATGGLGLGLSIAHAAAQSQGAALILQNRDGGGLRAIVRWPRRAGPAGEFVTDIPA